MNGKNMDFTVALGQFSIERDRKVNIEKAISCLEEAFRLGADTLLLPELFEYPYFPLIPGQDSYKGYATSVGAHPYLTIFREKAKAYAIAMPISFFEYDSIRDAYYNALVWINARGEVAGVYRKTHLPHGLGYAEDKYFTPGDVIGPLWTVDGAMNGGAGTQTVKIGTGICWDQWFVEPARIMALSGADILLYPSAIGSEPLRSDFSSRKHWQCVMCGHAAANTLPVVAANRIGHEQAIDKHGNVQEVIFYGSSFIAGVTGEIVVGLGEDESAVIAHTFNLRELAAFRQDWGLLQDRRPDLYAPLVK